MLRMLWKVNRIALRNVVRAVSSQGPQGILHRTQYRGISVSITVLANSRFGSVRLLSNTPVRRRITQKVAPIPKVEKEYEEFCAGSLHSRLYQAQILSFKEKMTILSDVCASLAHTRNADARGIINPRGIQYLNGSWNLVASQNVGSNGPFNPYFAPEFNGIPTEASDMFSFAVTMNEVLNQAPPYREGSSNLDEPDYGVDAGVRPCLFTGSDGTNCEQLRLVNELIVQNWDVDPSRRMSFKTLSKRLNDIAHSLNQQWSSGPELSMPSASLGWRVGAGVAAAGILSAAFPATVSFGLLAYGLTALAARRAYTVSDSYGTCTNLSY